MLESRRRISPGIAVVVWLRAEGGRARPVRGGKGEGAFLHIEAGGGGGEEGPGGGGVPKGAGAEHPEDPQRGDPALQEHNLPEVVRHQHQAR